jgi:hypothetical protein
MIESGTIFIEKNAPRPACFQLQSVAAPSSWAPVVHDLSPRDLEKALTSNGWTFFYQAGTVRATAFGFNPVNTTAVALKRLTASATRQGYNCLEIDEVAAHSFLGMPYISVSAHNRHVQKGTTFSGSQHTSA